MLEAECQFVNQNVGSISDFVVMTFQMIDSLIDCAFLSLFLIHFNGNCWLRVQYNLH